MWSPTTGHSSLYTLKLISSGPRALSGLLRKTALSTSSFVRGGYSIVWAFTPIARSGSRPTGVGGIGKKVDISSSALSSSVSYVRPFATNSGTSIGTPAGCHGRVSGVRAVRRYGSGRIGYRAIYV
jgi:hypothetical protein